MLTTGIWNITEKKKDGIHFSQSENACVFSVLHHYANVISAVRAASPCTKVVIATVYSINLSVKKHSNSRQMDQARLERTLVRINYEIMGFNLAHDLATPHLG